MRRCLSFLMASAILFAGVAIALGEIRRPAGRPFLLVGMVLTIVASGYWMFDEFRQKRKSR
jgi:hypothetical protein